MRIAYNLNCVCQPMTGVAYYTFNMVLYMLERYPELDIVGVRNNALLSKKQIVDFFSTLKKTVPSDFFLKKQLIEYVNQSYVTRSLIQIQRNIVHNYTLKKTLSGYIYHEPNFVFLPHSGQKILTVHDTSMFDCPEFLLQGRAKFLQKQMRDNMNIADALIVSCNFIKKQILQLVDIDESKIHIIAPGAQQTFQPRTEAMTYQTLEAYSLRYKKFLLCVATLEPRKNLIRLIEAHQQLPEGLQQEYPLILVGNKGWMYENLLQLIQKYKTSTIKLLRYLEEKPLLDLYSSAKLFIYPSLYEGFGLPVLEAMQSGVPVVVSKVSSLPEVCGNAGIMIDPLDENELSNAMRVILNASPVEYDNLVEKSLARAKEFSWENFAEKLYTVYDSLKAS